MYSWIEINKENFLNNAEGFISLVGKERYAPVLKSNAYGHGLEPVYRMLAEVDPEWLCVFYLSEAKVLRELGYKKNIFIVGPVIAGEYALAKELQAQIPIYDLKTFHTWRLLSDRPLAHLKIDTGLTRLGLSFSELERLWPFIEQCKGSLKGIYSHFANVEDVSNLNFAQTQLANLNEAHAFLKNKGLDLRKHIASSASSLVMPEARLDLCRIGISSYGFWPSDLTRLSFHSLGESTLKLKPALTWKTSISQIRDIGRGCYIGYGCTYQARNPMRVAILPIGYNEGFPRQASNKAFVKFCGQRCPVIGRICMNVMIIDISDVDYIDESEPVILLGSDLDITADKLASVCDTISYDIVTRINQQIPRSVC